ncbi:MAG: DUF5074 domain-containing protein [Tannerellaceae bacterium]|nr:DUF5074 domain-containing protein [Tannerellaceae bacterium]
MNKTSKLIKTMLLALCGLCISGGAQAGIRRVTSKADDGGEGTFRYIMNNLADGDIIEFDDALANDTIKLGKAALYPFNGSANFDGKNLTVLGNGVTIAGSYYIFGSAINRKMKNLWVENIHFTDIPSDLIFSATTGRIRGCSFSPTANNIRHLGVFPTGGSITFEGCAFIAKAGSNRQVYVSISNSATSFVSCTFVKQAGSYDIMEGGRSLDKEHSLIANNSKPVEMINCVVMDYSDGEPTFKVSGNNYVSKGYNVILQGSKTPLGWPSVDAAGDVVIPVGATPAPLTLDGGIYKVNTTQSPAYRRLPSQLQWGDNFNLSGVEFPEKDLAGNDIDYTCKTHSGAWQAVYLAPGETEPSKECDSAAPTGVTITPPSGTLYTEKGTYEFTAVVAPGDASQAIIWTSSDPSIATIANDGSKGILTPVAAGQVTITAASKDHPTVCNTVVIDIIAYPHVSAITLEHDTIRRSHHQEIRIPSPVVTPANALDKAFTGTFIDPENVVARNLVGGVYTLKGRKAGTAKLVVTAADGGATDTCVLIFTDPDYTDGVFMLTEGNFPSTGRLNFLHPDGTWDYDLYTAFNNPVDEFRSPARDFGVTSQFGAIYGGKFYVTSKQGARLVVFDPVTMEQHREFWNYPSGDGRAFLGVDDHTGYIGSSSGIHVINLDSLSSVPGGYKGSDKAVEQLPATTVEGTKSGSGLYTGQIGTMIRVGERVFAVHQSQGLLVINARTHTVETTLGTYHYSSLVQSFDGYLWGGATVSESQGNLGNMDEEGLVDEVAPYNALIRIDPWTLEETVFPLPAGVGAPSSTWAAWQADPFCSSPKENVLYWIDRKQGPQLIRRYDIDANTVTTVFDASDNTACPLPAKFPRAHWNMYGPSFRIHPATGDLYVWITLFHLSAPNEERTVWEVYRINPNTGEQLGHYPLKDTYWWPSLFIFPDNADPVIDESFPAAVTLNAAHRYEKLALRPLVSDADQMASAIVKTIEGNSAPSLIDAFIRHDSLFITPLSDPAAVQTATLVLKFNSNGKVLTRDITVTVQPSAGSVVTPERITLSASYLPLKEREMARLTVTLSSGLVGKSVRWSSSDKAVADVTPEGMVIAIAPGACVIKATAGDYEATCIVVVSPDEGETDVTGIDGVASADARVWHSNGTLYLENLGGHVVRVFRIDGQNVAVIRVGSDDEAYRVSLSAGVYILTAEKSGSRKICKFVVR